MIRFACSNCRRLISVAEKYSGKKGKCPKCGSVVVVPEKSTIIEFPCGSCGHKISVPERQGGKKGKCPKCKNPVVVPPLKKAPAEDAETVTVTCSMCGQIAEVPAGSNEALIECPACGLYIESSSESVTAASSESDTSMPGTMEEDFDRASPEEYDETEAVDRRLIILISAVAAIAVVGLVLLAVVLRPSRPQQQVADTGEALTQLELDEVQKPQGVAHDGSAAATAASEKTRSFFSKLSFGFAIVILLLGLVQVVSMWIVYEKAGEHGWALLVPFYGAWVLAQVGDKPGSMGVLMHILWSLPVPFVWIIALVLEVITKVLQNAIFVVK